ncbi:MAG: ExeA family protein [Planctomycetaceae bacterium]
MYESFWGLNAKPFENSGDGRLHYPSQAQQGALLKLRYAIENHKPASMLAGASGLGKTWLVQNLLRQLPERFFPKVQVVFPKLPPDQLLAHLADKITGESLECKSMDQSLRVIESRLVQNRQAGKLAVVVIDEAHLLAESQNIETIRLLLNLHWEMQPLASFVLVGQTNLAVGMERHVELDERLAVKCFLKRFSADETSAYIQHRLAACGCEREIFTSDALQTIHEHTSGIPRRINRLCDLALLVGFAEEVQQLNAQQLESISEELVGAGGEAGF